VWTHQTGQPPTSFNIIIFITIISRVAANPNFDLLRSQTSRASPPNSRPAEFHLPRLSRSLGIFVFFPVQVLVPLATNSPAIAASSVSIPFLVVLCRPVLFFAFQFFSFSVDCPVGFRHRKVINVRQVRTTVMCWSLTNIRDCRH
jgi:hypothetical protein